jgi:hypothetical protein
VQIALDHIVHIVEDLDTAAARLNSAGLRTVSGGRHPRWGTRNMLCHFGLTYVELLSVEDRSVAETSTFGRAVLGEGSRGDGIWRLALRTDDIESAVAKVRVAGNRCNGPVPGERTRPDGSTLRWSLAFPETPEVDLVPPMLIDWHEPDRRRHADLVARGLVEAQPPAVIAAVAVACRDPEAAAAWMHQAFGVPAARITTENYGPGLRISLRGGNIVFCGGEHAAPVVAEALTHRGERPFAVHLAAAEPSGAMKWEIGGVVYTFAPV